MHKLLCTILTLALILSLGLVCTAHNTEEATYTVDISEPKEGVLVDPEYVVVQCNKVDMDRETYSDKGNTNNPLTPYALTRIQFANINPGVYAISSDNYVVRSGSWSSLSIDTCVWAPEHYTIQVGFWNIDTGYTKYYEFTGGRVIDVTKAFTGMPAGTYKLFVVNTGANALTTGYMLYTVG